MIACVLYNQFAWIWLVFFGTLDFIEPEPVTRRIASFWIEPTLCRQRYRAVVGNLGCNLQHNLVSGIVFTVTA